LLGAVAILAESGVNIDAFVFQLSEGIQYHAETWALAPSSWHIQGLCC